MDVDYKNIDNDSLLLKKFNDRDYVAFGEVYLLFYDDIFHFASRLYRDTEVSAYDIIQDIFLNLWLSKKSVFLGLNNIKAYLFVSVRNSFRNYINHQKYKNEYEKVLNNDDFFIAYVVENEIFSFLHDAVDMLPEECGKVFRNYLEGFDTKEIALKLGKTESTIYNHKKNAIDTLKKKLSKDKMFIIMLLLS